MAYVTKEKNIDPNVQRAWQKLFLVLSMISCDLVEKGSKKNPV